MIDHPFHGFRELFEQLGLPSDEQSIRRFIETHAPLPRHVALPDAPFWTPPQAAFLRDARCEDADWAEVVDRLDSALRG